MAERPLLAICLDAADERLVRDLIDTGRLPALERLGNEGAWSDVRSPDLGSLTAHPTFSTGLSADVHGAYAEWPWSPERMGVTHVHTDHVRPFWQAAHDAGRRVGILDVPFHAHAGLTNGFEVTEWGAHDAMTGTTRVAPAALAPDIAALRHPFAEGRARTNTPRRDADLADMVGGCVEGAQRRGDLALRLLGRTRPDLAVIVFAEIHRASHDLWHQAQPDHPLYADMAQEPSTGLADVYRAVDAQVGRLIASAGDDTAVVVYSLFGMRPGRGLAPTILAPVLEALGYAHPARRPGGRRALAALKGHLPPVVKRLYDRRVPIATRHKLAAPTIMEPLDWTTTRAFSLPSDQHGWVRINLTGREADGIVPRGDYERLRDELARALSRLCTTDGRRIVHAVEPVAADGGPHQLLPDLVVRWSDAAFDRPVRLRDPALTSAPEVPAKTGQHRPQGFCIGRGLELPSSVATSELGALFAGG